MADSSAQAQIMALGLLAFAFRNNAEDKVAEAVYGTIRLAYREGGVPVINRGAAAVTPFSDSH